MTFLNRGRPVFGRIGRPSEPAPEPVAAVTGLPVAAPAPEGGRDDLRAARPMTPEEVEEFGARFAEVCLGPPVWLPEPERAEIERQIREEIREQLQHILDTEEFSDDHLGVQRVIELLEER